MKIVFKSTKSFEGFYAAEKFVKNQSMYMGSMQRDDPIGISKEDWVDGIKWRNITSEGRASCDGVIISNDMRDGDVTVVIFDDEDEPSEYI